MRLRGFGIFIVCSFLLTTPLFGDVNYIIFEIEFTRTEISRIENTLHEYLGKKEGIYNEMTKLNLEISENREKIKKIDRLIHQLTIKGIKFRQYSETINDKAIKSKVNHAIIQYQTTVKRLNNKRASLVNHIDKNKHIIEGNSEELNSLGYHISKKNAQLNSLKSKLKKLKENIVF